MDKNDTIEFQGKEYPVRDIDVPGFGTRRISAESLEEALIQDGKGYANSEAEEIDGSIFFYVPDKCMDYDNHELSRTVAELVG